MYLLDSDKHIIVKLLKSKLKTKFIYLFGTFAKGEGREDRDIDLAVYTDKKIDAYDLFKIPNQLSFEVKRDVQVVDLKNVDSVLASQIVGNREELYFEVEVLRANYNIRAFKDYVKLNEERKIILDAIKRDGIIYG